MARAPGGRRTTIYDVAVSAGSSPSTVSLVLSGAWARYRIKEETANRILECARRLDYNVNLNARGLRLSRSGLAGMIMPHVRNRFFGGLAESFEAEARRRGLCPIIVSTQRDTATEASVTETLLSQQVEFLFIAGVHDPTPLNRMSQAAEIACVNLDLPGPDAPSVVTDNRAGALRLTRLLIRKLKKREAPLTDLVFVGGVAGEYATDLRVLGFAEALAEAGVIASAECFGLCGYSPAAACEVIATLHERRGRLPSGLFINSITALEGLAQFASGHRRNGGQATVVGSFDWDPFAAHLPFDMAMLRQDVTHLIAQGFAMLEADMQQARPLVMVPPVVPSQGRRNLAG